ncbi:MAG: hypothetical protein WAV47_06435, partial [Blastocatellia bacterium]
MSKQAAEPRSRRWPRARPRAKPIGKEGGGAAEQKMAAQPSRDAAHAPEDKPICTTRPNSLSRSLYVRIEVALCSYRVAL